MSDQSIDLIRPFFDETQSVLGPWIREQNGTLVCILTHIDEHGNIERTTPDRIHGFFGATVDFETPAIRGALTFGDKDFYMGAEATPNGRQLRYPLWEWADACDRSELVPHDTAWVLQSDRLKPLVSQFANAFRELEAVVAEAAPKVVERISAARARRQKEWDAEQREAKHRSAIRLANEAFRRQEWRRVVNILQAVEDRLTPAESAKLDYARRALS
jgi:hypothetical protein